MRHAAVLDIGSSKVTCICGARMGKDGVHVHGAAVRAYAGYRFGEFANMASLKQAVEDAILATEKECDFRLHDVALCVPAPFSVLVVSKGEIDLSNHSKRITSADIDMLINSTLPEEPPEGCVLMHSTPYGFSADGGEPALTAPKTAEKKLACTVSHMYVQEAFVEPLKATLEELEVTLSACIAAPMAQAQFLIPQEQRAEKAVLVDVGYTHTDVTVIEYGAAVAMEVIEVGGMHFSNDLAYGLEIATAVAEQIKRRYKFQQDYQDGVEMLRTMEGTRRVGCDEIQRITDARASELASLIYGAMARLGAPAIIKPALYLTGGGVSMMRGAQEFFEAALHVKVCRDMPWMPRMSTPNYVSAFATLEFVLKEETDSVGERMGVFAQGKAKRHLLDLFIK